MTESKKEFTKLLDQFQHKYDRSRVWGDFINMFACALSSFSEMEEETMVEREASFKASRARYTEEEIRRFNKMAEIVINALERNPDQDFLGEIYMTIVGGKKGQNFTPMSISALMAKIAVNERLLPVAREKGYVTIYDPTCGSGSPLIAYAAELKMHQETQNLSRDAFFVGQDIDRTAAQMSYIQLTLIGCVGYIIVGNTLSNPLTGLSILLPPLGEGIDVWNLPMFEKKIWFARLWAESTGTQYPQD